MLLTRNEFVAECYWLGEILSISTDEVDEIAGRHHHIFRLQISTMQNATKQRSVVVAAAAALRERHS